MVKGMLVLMAAVCSVVVSTARSDAADNSVPAQLQQIQQQLQAIQSTLGTQGTGLSSLSQQLQTLQTTVNGQTQQLQSQGQQLQSQSVQLQALASDVADAGKPRKYYLTRSNFDGMDASGACAAGYHMASLWEIFDPSRLDYNTALGMTGEDSAQGPPNFFIGWIRTGDGTGIGGETTTPGRRSCAAYTSNDSGKHGVVVSLSTAWDSSNGGVDPWVAEARTCDQKAFVWCVQNQ